MNNQLKSWGEQRGKTSNLSLRLAFCLFSLLIYNISISIIPIYAWTDNEIANAIYLAEGGAKTKYPHGIKSIPTYGNKEYARKICLNSIRNHRKRHVKHNCKLDFISCLGLRFCPPKAHKLNKNWVCNVKFFLTRQK